MAYNEDEYLALSGLQHFGFCRRQWALIHIEHQWTDNFRTVDGTLMHERAHDKSFRESRGNLWIVRGMRVSSSQLGVSGECDVLEFRESATGVPLQGKAGLWQPYPIEYKRGASDERGGDALQLCGQAMCLEEMLCCSIPEGALYFGETRKRIPVALDEPLRETVRTYLEEMHRLYRRGYTPKAKPAKACNACSLKEQCLPRLMRAETVETYLKKAMEDEG